jgi:hypothetical protein
MKMMLNTRISIVKIFPTSDIAISPKKAARKQLDRPARLALLAGARKNLAEV